MCIGGRLGAELDLEQTADDSISALFSESVGRFVCEVEPEHLARFRQLLTVDITIIGHVIAEPALRIAGVRDIALDDLVAAFNGDPR